MGIKFRDGDIVRVTSVKGSLRWVLTHEKVGDKGTVVDATNQKRLLVDFGLIKYYVTNREIELVRRGIDE